MPQIKGEKTEFGMETTRATHWYSMATSLWFGLSILLCDAGLTNSHQLAVAPEHQQFSETVAIATSSLSSQRMEVMATEACRNLQLKRPTDPGAAFGSQQIHRPCQHVPTLSNPFCAADRCRFVLHHAFDTDRSKAPLGLEAAVVEGVLRVWAGVKIECQRPCVE